jgi:pimeloyl-ACP methyl ester carboxylesterase
LSQPLIVGIHGLNNKPGRDTLRRWWMAALDEGLRRNLTASPALPELRLCYWADLTHEVPYSALNDPEPYRPDDGHGPLAGGKLGTRRYLAALGLEAAGKMLETITRSGFLEERLEHLIETRANDLFRYHAEAEFRRQIRDRLSLRLHKAMRERRSVLLIAHSMGSIIAYDVLREHPALMVSHLVTIGSPLGLGEVKGFSSHEFGPPRIPDGVSRWTNLADPRDKIAALDLRLASDYEPGLRCARIVDRNARNAYVGPAGRPNPHKIYGYLRTPEMSAIIVAWLAEASA